MKTKNLKKIANTKRRIILMANITIHYTSEIVMQAKVFKRNLNDLKRFENETSTKRT